MVHLLNLLIAMCTIVLRQQNVPIFTPNTVCNRQIVSIWFLYVTTVCTGHYGDNLSPFPQISVYNVDCTKLHQTAAINQMPSCYGPSFAPPGVSSNLLVITSSPICSGKMFAMICWLSTVVGDSGVMCGNYRALLLYRAHSNFLLVWSG